MSGFKQANLDLHPKLFLTFDGDAFDPITFDLLGTPRRIIDESGEGNNAIFQADSTVLLGHRLGMLSLVELEPSDQYGISFGYYGAQPAHPSVWAKTYLEVPHSASFQFPDLGSYTISLMYQKAAEDSAFRAYPGMSAGNLVRPMINKGTAFKMSYIDNVAAQDQIQIVHPAGTMNFSIPLASAFLQTQNHIVFVWEVKPAVSSTYFGTAKLYINGTLVATQGYPFFDTYPNTNVASPIFVAGTTDTPGTNFNDRTTVNTIYDQIAIFDKALTDDEVGRLFKKTRTYERLVQASSPTHYWAFDDAESTTSTTITPLVGTVSGEYYGGIAKVLRRRTGPPNIPGAVSTYFQNGGCAAVHRTSAGYTPLFNPAGDYTIDFWFTCSSSDRGVILSMQTDIAPYTGMLLQVNRRNDVFSNGSLQFNVTEDYFVTSKTVSDLGTTPLYYNDGNWHHCALIRRNSMIEMWLDGILHSTISVPTGAMPSIGPGQLYLMAMMPGKLSVNGNLAHLAITNRALQAHEIRMRQSYAIIYRVKGAVTLQGVPYRANIRVYRHLNGELLQEILSDPNDGTYTLHLVDNSVVDLMILNMQDRNVRYRAFGPILPSTYDDPPV